MTAARPLPLAAGALVLAAAWIGPLPEMSRTSFAAHMTMHLAVVAVAAPLLAAAVAGGRLDPAVAAPAVFAPVPAAFAEFAAVWGWHAPAAHDLARWSDAWLIAEQASFLGAGLWLWLSVLGGDPARREARAAAGVGGLLLTSIHMTLLGALISLSPRLLYQACASLSDQQAGGVMMLVVGGAAYLAGGLWLLAGLLGREEAR